jgi:3-methyladenine DNA glycosylase AlkD
MDKTLSASTGIFQPCNRLAPNPNNASCTLITTQRCDSLFPMNLAALVKEIETHVERMPIRNTPTLRTLRREYSKRLKSLPAADVVKIAAALIAHQRVPRFVGDELISTRPDALKTLDQKQLEQLGSSISSWDQVDCFACALSGPAWREGQIADSTIITWARSNNRWWRRAALVSTVPLNVKALGGQGDPDRTLRICALLVDDSDETIVKALSWALRALAVRDPSAVQQFVEQYQSRLSALVRREVRNKLTTGRKTPIRRPVNSPPFAETLPSK